MKTIIFLGHSSFSWMLQRPQQLAIALSEKGYRVFFVSKHGAPVVVNSNLIADIEISSRDLPRKDVIVYSCTPDDWHLLKWFRDPVLWWDILDHESLKLDRRYDKDYKDNKLWYNDNADMVTYSFKQLVPGTVKTPLRFRIRNGCNPEWQDRAKNKKHKSLKNVPLDEPFVIYMGAIGFWLDVHLIRHLIYEHRDKRFFIIGSNLYNANLDFRNAPNLYMTDNLIWEKAQYILSRAKVSLVPFNEHPAAIWSDPIKIYEAAYYGVPSLCRHGHHMDHLITQAVGYDAFSVALENLFSLDSWEPPVDMNMFSWKTLIDPIIEPLEQL